MRASPNSMDFVVAEKKSARKREDSVVALAPHTNFKMRLQTPAKGYLLTLAGLNLLEGLLTFSLQTPVNSCELLQTPAHSCKLLQRDTRQR
jgi:hypothetical protein